MDRDELDAYGHRLLRAMTERDFGVLEEMLHPEVRLRSLITRIGREFRGLEGIRLYLAELDESFMDVRWDFQGVAAASGEVAVVQSRFRAQGRASGVAIDENHAQVWRFREGRGIENEAHRALEDALASAGLSA